MTKLRRTERPIIGITGTLGKTSITHLLTTLLHNAGVAVATGGNIGTGMLDLVQSEAPQALLELSSFQLEYCRQFAADGAIITNLYPNHLDRHETIENYFEAKKQILLRQHAGQWALVPLELAPLLRSDKRLDHRPLAFFKQESHPNDALKFLLPGDELYKPDFIQKVPPISYPQNWLIIAAALDLMGLNAADIIAQADNLSIPDYRLEKVAIINSVTYYNDSKSTIMQATLAAVDALQPHPIILLLGGTSKGVDRTGLMQQLKNKIHRIICFGAESQTLYQACSAAAIPAEDVTTLEDAVALAQTMATAGTNVLLSPGGASFDLFANYQARGERFKELVLGLTQSI